MMRRFTALLACVLVASSCGSDTSESTPDIVDVAGVSQTAPPPPIRDGFAVELIADVTERNT